MIGSLIISRKIRPATPVQAIKSTLREAERADLISKRATGATGATLLRMQRSPIDRLLTDKDEPIGSLELQAAHEISLAVESLTAGCWVASQSWERRDRGYGGYESAAIIDAQRRYQNWARHWSMRSKRGDPTFKIVFAAVIDQRPISKIQEELRLKHDRKVKKVIGRALRDYAARAGWVGGRLRQLWIAKASNSFKICQI